MTRRARAVRLAVTLAVCAGLGFGFYANLARTPEPPAPMVTNVQLETLPLEVQP